MNFEYFQIQKWMFQTVRLEKVDGQIGVICIVSIVSFFCNFVLTSARNLSLLKQYEFERSRYTLSENDIVYMLWLTVSDTLEFKVEQFY